MSIEQSMALKGEYTVMKAKLLKYEPQVKRKPIFPITPILDPSLKLKHILTDDQEYMMQDAVVKTLVPDQWGLRLTGGSRLNLTYG